MAERCAAAKILGPLTESIAKAPTSNALSAWWRAPDALPAPRRHRAPSLLRSRGARAASRATSASRRCRRLRGLTCAPLRRQGFRVRLRGRAFAAAQLERRGDLRLAL